MLISSLIRQILITTLANLKVRYRQSLFGFLWVISYPLIIFGVQGFAFHLILKVQVANYLLFLASGLIPWIFISQSVEMSANLILQSGPIINAYGLHPLVPVASQLCDSFLNFILSLLIISFFIPHLGSYTAPGLVMGALAILSLFFGVLAVAFCVAIGQVFYRDLKFVVAFIFQILFYLSPIFYPPQFIPENLKAAFEMNPVILWVAPIRMAILESTFSWTLLLRSCGFSMSVIFLAMLVWKRSRLSLGYHFG